VSPAHLDAVFGLLNRRTGLHFPPGRRAGAEATIVRSLTRSGADLDRYLALLAADGATWDDLIADLTVGETYFFREPAQFAFIRRNVLPQLVQRDAVRVWSAACASGEEAYSLAILFAETGLADRTFLLATDISRPALERARRATYTAWSLRGEGATLAGPYLRRRGNRFALAEDIVRRVTFAPLNLAEDGYPAPTSGVGAMDVILCRNVLIYFDRVTVTAVARRLFDSLAPGGWLFLGASDPPLTDEAPFQVVVSEAGVCYRRPASASGGRQSPESALPECALSERTLFSSLPRGADAPRSPVLFVPPPRTAEPPSVEAEDPVLRVRRLANVDPGEAERFCADVVRRRPLDVELCYLHAILLLGQGRDEEAGQALRRVLYLDRTLAVAHFALATLLERRGERAAACRAYRAAHDLTAARPADEAVPLADGEPAGRFSAAAAARLAVLDPEGRCRP
jgi:chemotaxis protein methyltransferase CheR